MRGLPQVAGSRLLPTITRARWSWRITRLRRRRRVTPEQELELMIHLAHEQRRALREGEYVPEFIPLRRWC